MKKKTRKIGIGFITGRKSFRDVLTTYMRSWGNQLLAINEQVELSLFVAYDLEYNNTQKSDYTNINIELREQLKDIHFISRSTIKAESRMLADKGIVTEQEATLLFEKGYAGKRNTILYTAIKYGMDSVLFLDDDEYPLAVQNGNGNESWTGQQILETHLKYIDDAHITNGYHCGYISPIPNINFNSVLSESDFQCFIEAICNDIINWESIKTLMDSGGITYASPDVINGDAKEIEQINNAKFITGSNICINLRNPTSVKPFYNPPGARGEDTFLSACLSEKTVLRIPCYTFHDGFSLYSSMLRGVLPKKLRHISFNTKKITTRFYNACIGWVRYKPLLVYITKREQYPDLMMEMQMKLAESLPKICEFFDNQKFMDIENEFFKYRDKTVEHYNAFIKTQDTWNKLIKSVIH